jgi:hypothetical protein
MLFVLVLSQLYFFFILFFLHLLLSPLHLLFLRFLLLFLLLEIVTFWFPAPLFLDLFRLLLCISIDLFRLLLLFIPVIISLLFIIIMFVSLVPTNLQIIKFPIFGLVLIYMMIFLLFGSLYVDFSIYLFKSCCWI